MDHCLLKLRECETNLAELKNLKVDEDRKYERLVKKNLLIGLTGKVRRLVKGLNQIKNVNTGGSAQGKKNDKNPLFGGIDEEDQSEFNFLNHVSDSTLSSIV